MRHMIYRIIKAIANIVGIHIARAPKPCQNELLKNVFKTSFPKNVLLSYITHPFINGSDFSHTNTNESIIIAQAFSKLGYNVDVVDYDFQIRTENFGAYNVVFGFGDPFCKSFYFDAKSIKRIYYGTGCYIDFQNYETLARVFTVYRSHGLFIPESGRIVENAWSLQTHLPDTLVVLGNEFTAKTYKRTYLGDLIYTLPASYFKVFDLDLKIKNFSDASRHFLWFGSSGLIHKGLDILLDIFSRRSDINLHIMGPVKNERRFEKVYFDKLYQRPNITCYDFVNINSGLFREVLLKCCFVLFPSASEGGSPSVITVMGNGGLIPIVTNACGIDLPSNAFSIDKPDSEAVEEAINQALLLTPEELYLRSLEFKEYVEKYHSVEQYGENIKSILLSILHSD